MYFFGVKASDDKLIICDALTRKVLKLSNIDATNFESGKLLSSEELFSIAQEHLPFLCDPERTGILIRRQNAIYNSQCANITVAFSRKCNLSCKYCYEKTYDFCAGVVDIDQLCRFIVDYMKTNDIDHLHIELYGGEPMLQKCEILELCTLLRSAQVDFSLSMMTNGTIYDEQFLLELVAAGLEKVEISIDGPEEIHNLQRPMKNNGNCYETVVSNIRKLCEIAPVLVRVNVGRNNVDYIQDLLDSLVAYGLHDRCFIYFTPIINSPLSFKDK